MGEVDMIIYRPHRCGLVESMVEAKEFDSSDEMKQYIVEQWTENRDGRKMFDVDDVVLGSEMVDDPRTGWHDTRYVCIKRFGDEDYMAKYGSPQCIGMCAKDYDSNRFEGKVTD